MTKSAKILFLIIPIIAIFLFTNFQNKTQSMQISNDNYEKQWQTIDSLEMEGLPKSALEQVLILFDQAKAENNSEQIIKALLYRGKYESQLEEDGLVKAIYKMEQEMEAAEFPLQAILQSTLAEMYQKYLQQNRWKFQNRTTAVDFKNADIRTWTIDQLIEKSGTLYLRSVANQASQNINLSDFSAILTKGQFNENIRPTLYDFLAHRAIDYFRNEQAHLTQPANQFYVNQADYFKSAAAFTAFDIDTTNTDITSYKYLTLRLFQDLLAFRQQKDNPAALVDADLKRLKFVYDQATLEDKFDLYVNALNQLIKKYDSNAEIKYQLANAYHKKGANYQVGPIESPEKWYWKKAHEIATQGISEPGKSLGKSQCQSLIERIEHRILSIIMDQVSVPEQPFLAAINYQNLTKLYGKVIRMNPERQEAFEKALKSKTKTREQAIFDFLNALPVLRTFENNLVQEGNFRKHRTEVMLNGLPLGQYAILFADNPDFVSKQGATGYKFIHISNLGFWQRKNNDNRDEFAVFNRQTGKPLANVAAYFSSVKYNSIFRIEEITKKSVKVMTDQNGFVIRPNLPKNDGRSNQFVVLFKNGQDTLFLDERYYYDNRNYDRNKPQVATHFFLDRAIYRPNQTVYFKGIAIASDKDQMPTIVPNEAVTITFRDANWQEVGQLKLKTNEYGTFNGNFTTPSGGLLGNMFLTSSLGNSQKNFRVEEYKRPKFEVNFEPIVGSFKLDETVKISGKAVAFAGNNIDGAKVTYRVVRKVRFPWLPYWYWGRGYFPYNQNEQEIAKGETTTDENGLFQLEFTALPDRSIPADKQPEFSYTIYADVVDITGETHSQSTAVKVGYVALNATLPIADKVHIDSLRKIDIITKNLNGEFAAAAGTLVLEKLVSPSQFFVKRKWGQPDKPILSKADFKKHFPHLAYQDEQEVHNWAVEKRIFSRDFNTAQTKFISIESDKIPVGKYKLTLQTKDKFGTAVKLEKYIEVYDLKGKKMAVPNLLAHHFDNRTYEPGDNIDIYFQTAQKSLPILFEMERDNRIISRKWLTIAQFHQQNYQVEEADRGNVHYHFSYAQFNHSFHVHRTVQVPWSNKELAFEYSTFRDKLQPGQAEEWIIKIKGPKGEKVAAEMVAGMYDASLDQFVTQNWNMNLFPTSYARRRWRGIGFGAVSFSIYNQRHTNQHYNPRVYQQLNWFNFPFYDQPLYPKRQALKRGKLQLSFDAETYEEKVEMAPMAMDEVMITGSAVSGNAQDGVAFSDAAIEVETLPVKDIEAANATTTGVSSSTDFSQIKVRTNLNETVFFYPNLMTDEAGNVVVKFTMNEALTKWKFLGLAHSKDLKIGTTTQEIITQKDLMIVPNPPRFFRERDEIEYSAKVVNLSEKDLSGNAQLQLVNPMDALPVYKWADNPDFNRNFTVPAGQSIPLAWRFKVPDITDVSLIEHTVLAAAGDFTDAERSVAPVLSNRMLVTETKPLPVRENSSKTFTFESLVDNDSKSLTHHAMTLEFTSNPAWYAVQALPYLMEYPHQCTEQIFSRYYANALATTVANSHPKIKAVFDKWRDYEPDALLSNLSKNQELKSALLAETPWVLDAQSEETQKKNIALLFDLNKMANEQEMAIAKLRERQLANGGWAWFPGGRDSWYISQYLVEGFGHLDKLSVTDITSNPATWRMVQKAVQYLDQRIVEDYEKYVADKDLRKDHLNNMRIHYLYARSYFLENVATQATLGIRKVDKNKKYVALEGKAKQVFDYYLGQAEQFWLQKGFYQEGMLSLALHRMDRKETTTKMIKSFKERSLNKDEMGMYWKYHTGYYWYQLPIETHALMIEVFEEIAQDAQAVNDLKVWLLKNKQTNHWKTTKATAAAVYALLMNGSQWLAEDTPLSIQLPNATDKYLTNLIQTAQNQAEAGTGYFKMKIDGEDVNQGLATIEIKNDNAVPAWGAAYWQYFEDLDKIKTFEETPLSLKKQLFKVENGETGEQLKAIEKESLHPGDKLKVRIELRVDRDMEYVHLKDMRASGFEPINVLSQYKWQDGLGYYESTRDAATDFFFSYLPKGTYVFEYPLRVIHKGDFSNGISTIQSMYAPEFSGHSEGIRVVVE